MKKWIPYLFCALAIMLFLSPCANDSSNEATTQQIKANEEVFTLSNILENPKTLEKLIKELKNAQKEKEKHITGKKKMIQELY
jgi:hypothetical protein